MSSPVALRAEQTLSSGSHGLDHFLQDLVAPLTASIRRAIESLPRRCSSGGELAQTIGLDQSSVWRIWQAAYATTLEQSALMVPGEAAMRRFISALVTAGLDPSYGPAILEGLRRFSDAVETEIGDVSTLRLMLAGGQGHLGSDTRYGRLLHDAHRLRLGIECAATLRIHVRVPSTFDGLVDVFAVNQLEKLRTLRTDPAVVGIRRIYEAKRQTDPLHSVTLVHEPFIAAEENAADGLPDGTSLVGLIPGASTPRGRRLLARAVDASSIYTCVEGGQTGQRGESTLAFGDVVRAYGPTFEHVNYWVTGTELCVPSELLVYELYVTEAEYQAGLKPTPRLYQMLYSAQPGWGTRLGGDLSHELEHYPPGRARPAVPELPTAAAVYSAMQQRSGTNLESLHLFRWRVTLPVVAVRYMLYTEGKSAKQPVGIAQ